ncbi:hypothetical protein [Streptomyces sp. CRN 30]|uniref:hypothetical protein n=1 Tax=Streptomyces sp. CRN 30 TaxID=3075613 RepID=UPI002A81D9CB|nr:hypothetical protein [Streptomyces sp. CRN 30]
MYDGVLSLGTAAVCASGCVWYLPAMADVRAGADRPRSQRSAALACLIAWGTLAVVAVLLLTPVPGTGTAVAAAAGLVGALALRVRARLEQGREQREARASWADLAPPGSAAVPSRPDRAGTVLAALALSGLVLTLTAAVMALAVVVPG